MMLTKLWGSHGRAEGARWTSRTVDRQLLAVRSDHQLPCVVQLLAMQWRARQLRAIVLVVETDLRLDDELCFALYTASRTAISSYRDALAHLGLTYTQFVTMLALWEDDGATVSALGIKLRLDSGTLSPLLRRLQDMGLVERRRDQPDERRVTVHLTARGQEIRNGVADVQRRLHASIDMTPDEVSTLRSLARRFCEAVGSTRSTG